MRLRYSLQESAKILGISYSRLDQHIRKKRIQVIPDGRRRFILREELERFAKVSVDESS